MQSDSALIGGETAIMPDLYQEGDFDMAGFSVGVVERNRLIDGTKTIRPGDVVVGLASNGFHSNGYSLIRKVVDTAGLKYDDTLEGLGASVADVLLKPTRLYVRCVRDILFYYRARSIVHGMAHITGGGLPDNLKRVLPDGCRIRVDTSSWDRPPEFSWLQQLGRIEDAEMYRVFNMGIGFTLIVNPYFADSIIRRAADSGVEGCVIGEVVDGERGVDLV